MDVRFSITIRQHARRRNLIDDIPEGNWTPIPYWVDCHINDRRQTPNKNQLKTWRIHARHVLPLAIAAVNLKTRQSFVQNIDHELLPYPQSTEEMSVASW